MVSVLCISALLFSSSILLLFIPPSIGVPFVGHDSADESSPARSRQVESGSACNVVGNGEVLSEDPCRPWCMCKDGVVVCAEIFCSPDADIPDSCGKIKVNGRCCPTFVCIHNNGSASMHYPLPLTVVPPNMYDDNHGTPNHALKEKRRYFQGLQRPNFV